MRGRALELEAARRNGNAGLFGVRDVAEPCPLSVDPIVTRPVELACAQGLALMSDRLDLLLGLGGDLRRERGVEQWLGHLLAVVYGPPKEVHQRLPLGLIVLILVDEKVCEGRNGIRILAGRVGN